MKRKSIAASIVLGGFFLLSLPATIFADSPIARFVFITEPQTIPQGELSGSMTIQAQDGVGNSLNTDETIDLEFSSTSSTGEFLSAAGEPVRTVMNKGTANRTFYYRDTSSGRHTIAVKAIGRVSGKSWTASQYSIIGTSSEEEKSLSTASTTTTDSVPASSHTLVASRPSIPTIEAYAGEDRVVFVGTEAEFIGSAVGLVREPIANARFWWNFGDGETLEGKSVGHVFRALGTYTVGLHVSSGDYAASDYLTVSVAPNQIAIENVVAGSEGYIRLENGAGISVDIGGWILEDEGKRRFYIPVRTVVGAHAAAAFANRVTGLLPEKNIVFRRPDESLAVSWSAPSVSGDGVRTQVAYGSSQSVPRHVSKESWPLPPIRAAKEPKESRASSSAAVHRETAVVGASELKNSVLSSSGALFGAALALSMGAAIGFFCLRRMIS